MSDNESVTRETGQANKMDCKAIYALIKVTGLYFAIQRL